MTIEQIARVCHEANRIYCQSIGDDSQPPWEAAPQRQRDAAIKGVQFVIGTQPKAYGADQYGVDPITQHNAWMKAKLLDGWTYGTVMNEEKKEHPSLLPYEYLTIEEQAKYRVFGAVLDALKQFLV